MGLVALISLVVGLLGIMRSSDEPEPRSKVVGPFVEVIVECREWHNLEFDFTEYLEKVALITLKYSGYWESLQNVGLSMLLADDKKLQQLNYTYRAQNRATNVLSFQYMSFDEARNMISRCEELQLLKKNSASPLVNIDENKVGTRSFHTSAQTNKVDVSAVLEGEIYDHQLFHNLEPPISWYSYCSAEYNEVYTRDHLSAALEDVEYMGDVAISYHRVRDESIEIAKNFKEHLTHIAVHGILHLFGYDHCNSEKTSTMEKLEVKILGKLGYPDPYKFHEFAIIKDTTCKI
ncbi:Endoribonuclease YbeY [Alphaproteobacteria bacterium]